MATTKNRTRTETNAEVTSSGIKVRGDPVKGKQQIVTVKSTPLGSFKKRLIASCLGITSSANAVGLAMDWTPDMVHVAYPLAGVSILAFVLIFLTKME